MGVPQMNDRYAEILNHFYPQDDWLTSNLWSHSCLYPIYHKCKKESENTDLVQLLIWCLNPSHKISNRWSCNSWLNTTAGEGKVDEKISESLVGSPWQKTWCSRDVHHFLPVSFFFCYTNCLPNLATWNSSHVLSHSFCRSGIQAPLNRVYHFRVSHRQLSNF